MDILEPSLMLMDGRLWHRWPNGTTLPVVSGGDGPEEDPPEPPQFTPITSQEEFDKIIGVRLRQERSKFPSTDELATLREKAKKFDDAQLEGQSELDRERTLREAAEKSASEALATAKRFKLEAAVMAAAGKSADPDLVTQVILADLDTHAVTIDDAGQVTGAETAVAALLEAKPYLAGKQPDPELGQGRGDADKPSGLAAGAALYEQQYPTKTD